MIVLGAFVFFLGAFGIGFIAGCPPVPKTIGTKAPPPPRWQPPGARERELRQWNA